jgi:hypothetical protein
VALGAAQPAQVPWAGVVALRGSALPPPAPGSANCSSAAAGALDIALTAPPSDGSTVVVQC